MCACKLWNVKLSLYYWTHWSCWWIYHFKHRDITRFFIIKPKNPGRLKKADLGGKIPQWEPYMVTCGKPPTTVTWSECLTIYYRVILTQERPPVEQSASEFRNLLPSKERTVTNCNLVIACLNKLFKLVNHIRATIHGHPQLFLKHKLPNRICFGVFDRCFCKVETRACETLLSCAKRLGGLAVTTLPGASRSFNPALVIGQYTAK